MGASIAKISAATASVSTSTVTAKPNDSLIPIVDEIRSLAADDFNEDPVAHAKLLSKIHALQLASETPLETIYRIGHQSWQNAAIKVALDLGILDVLVAREPRPVGADELASKHNADVVLVARIMRVITALGLCAEVGVGMYVANSKTTIMTVPQGITSFQFWVDMAMPAAAQLPDYLRANSYRNPHDNKTTAFARAFGSEFWTWLKQNPRYSTTFNGFMASRREGRPSWFDIYPVEQELSGPEKEKTVTLVEIGGNQGHDLVNLKAKHPNLQGRMVLQDLPDVVAKVKFNDTNIAAMGHNFFDPQPIKHAHAYHFRAIFHDWADADCVRILTRTARAMQPGFSKLLISEFVLANSCDADETTPQLFPASLDLQMMGLHAGMERPVIR
ncbi:MAG: hypothetical protein ASARMPRED_006771 [Alectoria sarmentosa]|nr:MAG: hypothetical protein ASARMPRED_006771 [Alectoria sarmentosa]